MQKLKDEKGSLALAIVVALFAIFSGFSIIFLGYKDTRSFRLNLDAIQELHLIRTEAGRGLQIMKSLGSSQALTVPMRTVTVSSSDSKHRRTYSLKSKIVPATFPTNSGLNISKGYVVKTLSESYSGKPINVNFAQASEVKRYSEKYLMNNTFAGYHYFTDTDESENADMGSDAAEVYFYGRDEIWGKVHSNGDIHLKNLYGWPTFHDDVYTAGEFRWHNGGPAYGEVFLDDYYENASIIEFNPSADLIRQNGAKPFGSGPSTAHEIIYVKLNGSEYSSWYGNIVTTQVDTFEVWGPNYPYPPNDPDPEEEPDGYNYITHVDTLWEPGPDGSVHDGSVMVFDELWIEGIVGGRQTWGCADTIYITSDITLENTTPGTSPDGYDIEGNFTGDVNQTDYFGLVSEERIYIRYKNYNPADSSYIDDNTDDIYIYGALAALGDGGDEPDGCHEDGIFSFQYQHPHPSTEPIFYSGELYTEVDLHRFYYPGLGFPTAWPADVDYPWYNPAWPEENPTFERGAIFLFGSVAQRRRGFVHRSGSDPANHDGTWDFENYKYGATHFATGYDKEYRFDRRFSWEQPPDYPETHIAGGKTPFEGVVWKIKKPPLNF